MSKEKVFQGTVKSYNEKKGYGFIIRKDNNEDIFFHVSDLLDRDHNPQQNDEVEFELTEGRKGRQKAIQVKRVVE
ncbi:unnamed protein product [marine sediment metagenome]|uniref:CSD domain-containing protein n=1 Tax=marine sediment metagenome TaxID=412755 RepID=X1SDJ7_9ZZZZ